MVKLFSISELKRRVDKILTILSSVHPNPHCELFYTTPYQLLVSVVLSAQATDKSVNTAMTDTYKNGFTVDDAIKLGFDGILKKIRKIGLAPTKAKNVLNLSLILKDRYQSMVPSTREDLESLPGVGRKTANVVLGEIFGQPTLAVDTHVYRVTARLGLHHQKTPEQAEMSLLKIIDPKWLPMAHHCFILHGRYTCTARAPKCQSCCLNSICTSQDKIL